MTTLLSAGAVFASDYKVVRPLNQGGMGAVYVVEQLSTSKLRALKLMHPQLVADPELRRRFEQEARVGARIPSEHVVEVNAAGIDPQSGMPYLVMELLEGEDLAARIKRGQLSMTELRAIFEQLCHAMNAAHAAGIVHRDLKPENIFLAVSRRAGGAPFTVKVLDFGIAKLAAEAGTHGTTGAMGSPLWMAPEQTDRGAITPAADVWAMGLIAYHALTGTHFWRTANTSDGTMAQLLREIVLEPIPPPSVRASERGARLPPGFEAWFQRCVAREPAHRFQSAGEAWRALDALPGDPLGATALGAPPISSAPAPPAVISAPPITPAPPIAPPPTPAPLTAGTPAPMATTSPPAPSARWVLATAILAGAFVAVSGLAVGGYFVLTRSHAAAPSTPPSAPPVVSSVIMIAPSISAAPSATLEAAPSATLEPAPSAKPAARTTPTSTTKVTSAPSVDDDPNGPNGSMNTHTWKLKNEARVRMLGALVKNDSNVADTIVRKAVEWSAWQYNRCYDASYGHLSPSGMPAGTVVVGFDIEDQLPRRAKVDRSDFKEDAMGKCVASTLLGQTINAAGPSGAGHVTYSFKFVPN